jgi:hypothetical protein
MNDSGRVRFRRIMAERVALAALLSAGPAFSDSVKLKSGAVISGEIQAENADELRLLVSRTATGDIQTVKIIAQRAIAGLQRDMPTVAVEPDPEAAPAPAEAAPAVEVAPTLAACREAIRRADGMTGEGRYDEAAAQFRAVIDRTGRAATVEAANEPARRLELLQLRQEACQHLVIALRGKLNLREETLRAADDTARRLERRLEEERDALDDLRKEEDQERDETPKARRMGDAFTASETEKRARALVDQIAREETRLRAHRQAMSEEQRAIVNLESEIKIAEAGARQATDDCAAAARQSRARR